MSIPKVLKSQYASREDRDIVMCFTYRRELFIKNIIKLRDIINY